MDEESGARHLTFGSSYKTSDFIVDVLEAKWAALDAQDKAATSLIQITMANGPESSGKRTPFLPRLGQLADTIQKPIPRLYYPPSHSTYTPLERCWGILELQWNGAKRNRCRDHGGVGEADDLEGSTSGRRTQPHTLAKGHLARQSGDTDD